MTSGMWRATEGYVGCLRKADMFRRVGAGVGNKRKRVGQPDSWRWMKVIFVIHEESKNIDSIWYTKGNN